MTDTPTPEALEALAHDVEHASIIHSGDREPGARLSRNGKQQIAWALRFAAKQRTDTQADLTERALIVANKVAASWSHLMHAAPLDGKLYAMIRQAAQDALQSEREAAAAEARKIIQDLVENFGAGGPEANKAFAVATRYLLASPAPQEETVTEREGCWFVLGTSLGWLMAAFFCVVHREDGPLVLALGFGSVGLIGFVTSVFLLRRASHRTSVK